jgi:hypothetical protein
MSGGIFICYRREDSAAWAGRIYDRLTSRFEHDQVFIDVDNIEPGLDFVKILSDRVGDCDALVAIIGREWLGRKRNRTRLDDPNDFVRIEIEAALTRNVRVIPVLVDGATMPREEVLPEAMKGLVRRQKVDVSHVNFDSDAQRLTKALAFVEAERRKREAAETERLAHEQQEREAARKAEDDRSVAESLAAIRAAEEPLAREQREKEVAEKSNIELAADPSPQRSDPTTSTVERIPTAARTKRRVALMEATLSPPARIKSYAKWMAAGFGLAAIGLAGWRLEEQLTARPAEKAGPAETARPAESPGPTETAPPPVVLQEANAAAAADEAAKRAKAEEAAKLTAAKLAAAEEAAAKQPAAEEAAKPAKAEEVAMQAAAEEAAARQSAAEEAAERARAEEAARRAATDRATRAKQDCEGDASLAMLRAPAGQTFDREGFIRQCMGQSAGQQAATAKHCESDASEAMMRAPAGQTFDRESYIRRCLGQ